MRKDTSSLRACSLTWQVGDYTHLARLHEGELPAATSVAPALSAIRPRQDMVMERQGPGLTPETASMLTKRQSLGLLRVALRISPVPAATEPGWESRVAVPAKCVGDRTG